MENYFIYILTNDYNEILYIGVTNDLLRRVSEHKTGQIDGFTKKYGVKKLVYYETYNSIKTAIAREKQLKRWRREKKNALIESFNPNWEEIEVV